MRDCESRIVLIWCATGGSWSNITSQNRRCVIFCNKGPRVQGESAWLGVFRIVFNKWRCSSLIRVPRDVYREVGRYLAE